MLTSIPMLMQRVQIGQRAGKNRYDRSCQIEAAHRVIVITAYFEALQERELSPTIDRFGLTKTDQVRTGSGASLADARDLAHTVLNAPAPLPPPQWGQDRIRVDPKTPLSSQRI